MASLAVRGVEAERNYGHADYIVKPGEAVAQMVLEKVSVAKIKELKGFDGPSR